MSARVNGWQVLASAGNARLGGEDFDARIVDVFVRQFDPTCESDHKAMARLKQAANNVKHRISTSSAAHVTLGLLSPGRTFHSYVQQEKFAEWNHDYFQKMIAAMEQVLED
jgi:heat shock protein 5